MPTKHSNSTLPMSRFFDVPFVLAPMDGFSKSLYRRFMRMLGCGFVVSEFVAANEIRNRSRKTLSRISYLEEERPYGIQIYGNNVEALADAASFVQDYGADFCDINLGCPIASITRAGKGAGWLRTPRELGKMLEAVRTRLKIPLSIKIRTGFDSVNATLVASIAADVGVDWMAIHGRTAAQAYTGQVDWTAVFEAARCVSIPVMGNGDITEHSKDLLRDTSPLSGLMIGRRALQEPRVFLRLRGLPEPTLHQCLSVLVRLLQDEKEDEEVKAFLTAKHVSFWFHDHPDVSRGFRGELFRRCRMAGTWADGSFVRFLHDHIESFNLDQPATEHMRKSQITPLLTAGAG